MRRLALATIEEDGIGFGYGEAEIAGVRAVLDPSGALYLPEEDLLCVSDLHLEKGAAFARRGQLLPPWDTLATLRLLAGAVARHQPRVIVSLGDNFHDRRGSELMDDSFRAMIGELARGRDLIWISGNHDPDGVSGLPGVSAETLDLGVLHFRHEPRKGAGPGEIAGHLHPSATLVRRERGIRRPCFATDGARLIMPSFGVTTGGLDLGHKAFAGLFDRPKLTAHLLGRDRVYPLPYATLGSRSAWR